MRRNVTSPEFQGAERRNKAAPGKHSEPKEPRDTTQSKHKKAKVSETRKQGTETRQGTRLASCLNVPHPAL